MNQRDFDPTLLRTFAAVVEHGGFTRAAERLHLSQSAVSHQIRRLEEQAGRPLLARTTRALALTEDGEEFLCHAEVVLSAHEALMGRFQPSPVSGVVRFGVPDNYLGDRLPGLLARFARAHPAVRLEATVAGYFDLRTMVDSGELDLAVTLSTALAAGELPLRQTQFVWAAAADFRRPDEGPLPLAFQPAPCVHRTVALDSLVDAGIPWRVAFTSLNAEGVRAATEAGLGVTAIPHDELRAGIVDVGERLGLPPLPEATFVLLWADRERTDAAAELGQLLTDAPAPTPTPAPRANGALA